MIGSIIGPVDTAGRERVCEFVTDTRLEYVDDDMRLEDSVGIRVVPYEDGEVVETSLLISFGDTVKGVDTDSYVPEKKENASNIEENTPSPEGEALLTANGSETEAESEMFDAAVVGDRGMVIVTCFV